MKRIKGMYLIYLDCEGDWCFCYAVAITVLFITTPIAVQMGTWPTDPMCNFLIAVIFLPIELFWVIGLKVFTVLIERMMDQFAETKFFKKHLLVQSKNIPTEVTPE